MVVMARFKYKAIDHKGDKILGEINAPSEGEVYSLVKTRKLSVFHIKKVSSSNAKFSFNRMANHKDLARYMRQLTTLISAGVTLLEAFNSLSKSNAHPALAKSSQLIRKDLRSGQRFSQSLEKHLPALPPYVPRLAELGEATGQLAGALDDACQRMEFDESLRQELRTALSYPIFLSVVGGIIVLLMFVFVVPRFGTLLGNNSENLPVLSKWVIGVGLGLKEHFFLIMGGCVVVSTIIVLAFKRMELRQKIRIILEHIPLIRSVLVKADLGGWCQTVGIALENGADLLSALRLGEYSLASPRLKRAMAISRSEIRAGKNIDEVLAVAVPDFDPLTIDLIQTGRASSELSKMLLFVGETQETETREMAKRLSTLAEPIAILVVASIVGTIVIGIVMAMTSIYEFNI
jgi:type II secretory pathway component PulF